MEYITSKSYGGRYLKLSVWQKGTEPNVYWKLESIGGSSQYYNISPITVIIDGKTVWSHAATDWSDKVFPAATGVYPSDRAGWTENIGSYKRVPFYLKGRPGYSDAGDAIGNVITLVAPTYTITFDNCDLPAGTKQYDVPYTLPTPTREGQVFRGWLDAEGELRPAGYQYTANANATFTADWAPAITTLNFDGNGGTLSDPALELELSYGESLFNRIGVLQTATREEGYVFVGWQVVLGEDREFIYDANGNYVVGQFWKEHGFFNYISDGGTITAKAVWSPRTYNINLYGTNTIPYTATKASTLVVNYKNGTTFRNVTPPIPDGYEFTGYWIGDLSKAVLPYYNPVIPIEAATGTTLNTPGDRTFYAIYHDITPSKVVLSKSGYGKIATETSLDDYCDILFSDGEIPETGDDIFGYYRFTTSDNNPCALSDSFDFEMTNHEGSEIPSTTISYVVRYSGNDTIVAFRTTYVDTEDVYHASLSNVFDELHKPVGTTFILDIVPAILLMDINETRLTIGTNKKAPDDGVYEVTSYYPVTLRDEDEHQVTYKIIPITSVDGSYSINLPYVLTEGTLIPKDGIYYVPDMGEEVTIIYGTEKVFTITGSALIDVVSEGTKVTVRFQLSANTDNIFPGSGRRSLTDIDFYVYIDLEDTTKSRIEYVNPITSPESNLKWKKENGVFYLSDTDEGSAEGSFYLALNSGGGDVYWNDVLNKPTTFPPAAHTHNVSDITATAADNGKVLVVVDGQLALKYQKMSAINIHDTSTDIKDIYYSNGTAIAYNGWDGTDYIEVNPEAHLYTISASNSYTELYDADKVFILKNPSAISDTWPENTRYIRYSDSASAVAKWQLAYTDIVYVDSL